MKASELIDQLLQIVVVQGDLDVVYLAGEMGDPESVMDLVVKDAHEDVFLGRSLYMFPWNDRTPSNTKLILLE